MRLRGCGVAASAVLLAALAACGGSSSAADPSSPLPITSARTPSTAAPSTSAALDPNSDAAVVNAVRDYVAAFQEVGRTGNLSQFFAITTSTCNCRTGIEQLAQQITEQKQHTDVLLSAVDIQVKSRKGSRVEVVFSILNPTYHVYDETGHVSSIAPAAKQPVDVSFMLQGNQWVAYLAS